MGADPLIEYMAEFRRGLAHVKRASEWPNQPDHYSEWEETYEEFRRNRENEQKDKQCLRQRDGNRPVDAKDGRSHRRAEDDEKPKPQSPPRQTADGLV